MLQRVEMDRQVTLLEQLAREVGPVILVNTFQVEPEDADALLEAWAADAAYMKAKSGYTMVCSHFPPLQGPRPGRAYRQLENAGIPHRDGLLAAESTMAGKQWECRKIRVREFGV